MKMFLMLWAKIIEEITRQQLEHNTPQCDVWSLQIITLNLESVAENQRWMWASQNGQIILHYRNYGITDRTDDELKACKHLIYWFLFECHEIFYEYAKKCFRTTFQLDLYQPFITLHQPVRANEDCAEYLSVWMLKLTEVHWSAACASSHMNVFFTPCYCCLLHFEDAWVHPYLARRH